VYGIRASSFLIKQRLYPTLQFTVSSVIHSSYTELGSSIGAIGITASLILTQN